MSSLAMTAADRESFLADIHVGVLSVARRDGPPSSAPVWYRYAGGVVQIATAASTTKVRLLRAAGEASLCVQREEQPYAYVTVEGPVTVEPAPDAVVEAIAVRYLGERAGKAYASGPGQQDDTLVTLTIQRWRTLDFTGLDTPS